MLSAAAVMPGTNTPAAGPSRSTASASGRNQTEAAHRADNGGDIGNSGLRELRNRRGGCRDHGGAGLD